MKTPYINQEAVKIPIALSTQQRLMSFENLKSHFVRSSTGSGFQRDLANWRNKNKVLPTNVLHLSP